MEENVGTSSNFGAANIAGDGNYPLELKGNLGVNWQLGRWSAGSTVRYFDSYRLRADSVGADLVLA